MQNRCARAATDGGLGLQPSELGEALIPLSVTLLCTPLLYPIIERRVGHYGCFRLGSVAVTCAVVLMSLLPTLRERSSALLWAGLSGVGVLRGITGPLIFSSLTVIFNDMLVQDIGYWNGVASSVGSLCRGLAPIMFGSIFAAVNAAHAPFPLDAHLPFLLVVVVVAILVLLVGRDPSKPRGTRRRRTAGDATSSHGAQGRGRSLQVTPEGAQSSTHGSKLEVEVVVAK